MFTFEALSFDYFPGVGIAVEKTNVVELFTHASLVFKTTIFISFYFILISFLPFRGSFTAPAYSFPLLLTQPFPSRSHHGSLGEHPQSTQDGARTYLSHEKGVECHGSLE